MRKILIHLIAALIAVLTVTPSLSQDRQHANAVGLFSKESLGESQDQWHAVSYIVSAQRRPDVVTHAPEIFGQGLEHRLRREMVAPTNLTSLDATGRPDAGVLSYGLHSHSVFGDVQNRVGVDVIALGPQSTAGRSRNRGHHQLGSSETALSTQLPNAIYPTLSGEVARPMQYGGIEVRPFAEAQYGVETFARIGADVFFGDYDVTAMRLRDVVSGQLYRPATQNVARGSIAFMVGADVAQVWSSEYLAASDGYVVEPIRFRGRAGVQLSAPRADMFYGVSWLSPEFEGQSSGQLVGSLDISLRF